jgi:multidrug resistance efflux pump
MRHPVEQLHSANQIETEHRQARARLEAANARLSRAVAEHERLTGLAPAVYADEPEGIELETALDAAEAGYRAALEAMKTDSSDAARWRCARALIEFDRLSDLATTRRGR